MVATATAGPSGFRDDGGSGQARSTCVLSLARVRRGGSELMAKSGGGGEGGEGVSVGVAVRKPSARVSCGPGRSARFTCGVACTRGMGWGWGRVCTNSLVVKVAIKFNTRSVPKIN